MLRFFGEWMRSVPCAGEEITTVLTCQQLGEMVDSACEKLVA